MDKVLKLYRVKQFRYNVYEVIGTEPMRDLVGAYAEVGFEDEDKHITIINYDIYKDEIGDAITKAIDKYRLDSYISKLI